MKSMLRWCAFAACLPIAAFALAQETLYAPTQSLETQGISVEGWGNGSIAESTDRAVDGTTSLRISSRNFFQGGIINYAQAIDVSAGFADSSNLLQLTMSVPGATGSAAGGGGGIGKPGVGGGIGRPGGIGPGDSGQTAKAEMALKKIRLVIGTSDGLKSEAYLDITTVVKTPEGWFNVGVPLQAINGLARTNKKITSIAISGDSIATYYIGKIRIFSDTTPVFAQTNAQDMNIAYGDIVNFVASGYAGSTPVKFMWDFNAADGIQVDAEGQTVKRKFLTPGTYTVTLTAVDIYGLKKPYSTTFKVTVNP